MRGKIKVNSKNIFRIEVGQEKITLHNFVLSKEKHKNKWCELTQNEEGQVLSIIIEDSKEKLFPNEALLKKNRLEQERIKAVRAEHEALQEKEEQEKFLKEEYEKMKRHQSRSIDSYEIEKAILPKDTKCHLIDDSDNFHLKFNKLSRCENFNEGKFKFFETNKGKIVYQIKPNFSKIPFQNICLNQRDKVSKLCYKIKLQNLSIDWRLTIGLGNDSVYETSITLHHLYGIPYIPASSVKGIVRSWIIQEKEGIELDSEAKAFAESEELCKIFGCGEKTFFTNKEGKKDSKLSFYREAREGQIIFFDAFPTSEPKVEADIMNPHYPNYYGEDEPPTDFQNPIPINFLTVKDCSFQFIIGIRSSEDKELLKTATKWLKEALTHKGIGAKTAVGYGYMTKQE